MLERPPCVAALCSLLLGACLSSSPPAPAVRFFDCAVQCERLATGAQQLPVPQVVSGTGTGIEFAVRVGPHELSLDGDHRWLMPPEQLVAAALRRALYVDGPFTPVDGGGVLVTVQRFEFDLTGAPTAVVVLLAPIGGREQEFAARIAAGGGEAPALAAAMASALTQAVTALRAALSP